MTQKYVFDDNQYELCKNYVMPVYRGTKDGIIFDDENKTVTVIGSDCINEFTDAADYAIVHYGMVNFDYLSPLGCKLQFLYDEIYYQTK